MKIIELFSESNETRSVTPLDHLSDDEIINIIHSECSDILKIYRKKQTFLLRGENKDFIFFKSSYPKNRKPKDSPIQYHDFLNNALKKSGFVATRENSVFVTPMKGNAEIFGNIYIFFPINGFHYTWSEKIVDAYENFDIFAKEINNKNIGIYLINSIEFYELKKNKSEKEFINKMNYFLQKKFSSISEVFNFIVKFYHEDYFSFETWKKIMEYIHEYFVIVNENNVDMNKIYDIVGSFYKKDNLELAILNSNEIMFTNSYYYMLSYTKDISDKIINFLYYEKQP